MGDAKRRREYWEKQGKAPPPSGAGQRTSTIDKIKREIKQTRADTEQVKRNREFKRQCQLKHDSSCRDLKEKLALQDFKGLKEATLTISSNTSALDQAQLKVWSDYMIVGLLDNHKIDGVQAQLFVRELANKMLLDSNKSHIEYLEEQHLIDAEKDYLKVIERWVYIDNPLLSIYQSFTPASNI